MYWFEDCGDYYAGGMNYLADSYATKRIDLSIHNDENTNMKDYLRVWSNKSKTLPFFLHFNEQQRFRYMNKISPFYVAGCFKCAQQREMNLNTQTQGEIPDDVSIYI